jgi:hypothetical protein
LGRPGKEEMLNEQLRELSEIASEQRYRVNVEQDTVDLIPTDRDSNPSDTLTVRFDEKGIQAAITWLKRKSHKPA